MALKAAKKEVEEVLRREQSLKTKLEAFQDEIQNAYARIHTLGGEVSQALSSGLHMFAEFNGQWRLQAPS